MNLYDVIIVGGSHAGLSTAMTLGRSLRRVLVIDNNQPCNRQTPYSHNFLTRDGETPATIAAIAREQVLRYPTVTLQTATVVGAAAVEDGFEVTTAVGEVLQTRKLLLATGLKDEMLPITGFAECWGISVLHCPYCHGYEVHGDKLGILANGNTAAELVSLIYNWSRDLVLFTNGPADFTAEQIASLQARKVQLVETPIVELEHSNGRLHTVRTTDGIAYALHAIFARVPFRQHSDLAAQLNCTLTDNGLIQATEFGETNVPGLFAAGDNTTLMRQVASAVANGTKAAAWINKELIQQGVYSPAAILQD
ncbi:NAD(P)/FAD-dependent oxidoreductase [Hymenobacter volaticus]|uniref:NAD(P)/FAD-dependent oxidoreductase n=1 Tax=Hymenobacter volaticus TaxID=2932254 RepID=A0ABY4G2G8_9BACT|nr:NAD(P)/FAD-dependent oxidoreductase [Hymenobacter volaticus]UOQ65069.1 NAD(P)/FAD-dependent oxidoreductase [Hymenobacter volaticus]